MYKRQALVLKQTYTGTPEPGGNKQYAVFNLVGNMTTPSFAQRLAQFFDQFQDLVDLPTTTPTASSIPIAGSGGTLAAGYVSYTHLRAHETVLDLVCRLLLEKKNTQYHKD